MYISCCQQCPFVSDGPTTQYKNKTMFFLFAAEFPKLLGPSNMTWNFIESGHGKGAADGIVRVNVHECPSPSRPRNGQETAGTSYVMPHICVNIESDADPVVPSKSSNIPIEGSMDVAERESYNQSDKHYTKLTLNSNCIPEFNPSNESESCARWLDKIDQLAT
nr:unnamed protein product [Callosobruchus analis]